MTEPTRLVPSSSRTAMTELVLPEDTNTHGDMFGGRVLALADKCAGIAAMRHCRMPVVTVSMDRIDFLHPIRQGMIVMLSAELTAAFRTSMEVVVAVEAEDPRTGERTQTCRALVTLVALNENGRPAPIPPLEFDTNEERARAERAAARRAQRLVTRGEL